MDLKFIDKKKFDEHKKKSNFYYYNYGGESYGFFKSSIDEALQKSQHVFIIVRDLGTIKRLMADYPIICTIPVFIYTDREKTVERLLADGYSQDDINFRLERQGVTWNDYLKHSVVYKEIIINNSNKTDLNRLIDNLVNKYSPENESRDILAISNCEKYQLLDSLIGFKKMIETRSESYDRNIFLMMKFRDNNKLVYRFIKTQLEKNGFNCIRADEPGWNITRNVYNPLAIIYCCKYGIALFDEPEEGNEFSPNVAYELSMMHLQRKNCLILLHKSLPAVPFDFIKDLHKKYSEVVELEEIVSRWVSEIKKENDMFYQKPSKGLI
jgi:guanylate kinase